MGCEAWQCDGATLSVERGGDEEQSEKRAVRVREAKEFATLRVVEVVRKFVAEKAFE